MVSSNPCVNPSLRIKISLFFLSTCTDKLTLTAKKMGFFPKFPSVNKTSEQESNPLPLLLFLYLSRSQFLVRFTYPNKQLPNLKSMFKFFECGCSL